MPFDGTKNALQRRLNKARLGLFVSRANIEYEENNVDRYIRDIARIKREAYEQEIDLE